LYFGWSTSSGWREQAWQNRPMTAEHEFELLARIVAEPEKMGGKPIIRGRRITPAMVLNMLANGSTREQVLAAYPVLEDEDIDACLLYAARLAERSAVDGQTVAAE
jgi:uncharacterized protein (DUF433 family)